MAYPNATQIQMAKEAGVNRRLFRRAMRDIGYEPFATPRGRKLAALKGGKGAKPCTLYLEMAERSKIECDRTAFADGEIFRCGGMESGSGRNNCYCALGGAKNTEIEDPRLYRASETHRKSTLVGSAVPTRGAIRPDFV